MTPTPTPIPSSTPVTWPTLTPLPTTAPESMPFNFGSLDINERVATLAEQGVQLYEPLRGPMDGAITILLIAIIGLGLLSIFDRIKRL